MIEIRVEEGAAPVRPDGPHDHESTRAVAAGIDEAFRLLNYATMPGRGGYPGLRFPSDVYSVLGELSAAFGKFPQALDQMRQFIAAEVSEGWARENPHFGPHGGDAEAAHVALAASLTEASAYAQALAQALGTGQSAVRGMESTREEDW